VDTWFYDPKHVIWDDLRTSVQESRADIIFIAFDNALKVLKEKIGDDMNKWHWGELHYFQPKHFFGSKAVLSFFNLDRMGLNGSLDSVWKAHFNLHNFDDPFKVVAGPAFRLAVDLADLENAQYSIDTGESGWPNSPHYGDIYRKWQVGELIPMYYDWSKIKQNFSRLEIK
jgi:penicillin amidase